NEGGVNMFHQRPKWQPEGHAGSHFRASRASAIGGRRTLLEWAHASKGLRQRGHLHRIDPGGLGRRAALPPLLPGLHRRMDRERLAVRNRRLLLVAVARRRFTERKGARDTVASGAPADVF